MAGPPPTTGLAVTVEELAAPATDLLVAAMGPEGDRVEPRLARGCRCFAACVEGRVAGYGWLSAGPEWIGEVGLELRPGPAEAYVWNCVTLPRDRRRGIFRALLRHVAAAAAGEGLRRLWIASGEGGAESAVVGAGFAPVLVIRTRRGGPVTLVESTAVPGAKAAAVDAARAALQLRRPVAIRRTATRRH